MDRRLAFVRELEEADRTAAGALAELDEAYRSSESIRERALALREFFERLPDDRAAAAGEVDGAGRREADSREAADQARIELERAERDGDAERIAAARRFEARTRDALRMAERRLAEAESRAAALEKEAEAAERDARGLGELAEAVAQTIEGRPRVAAGAAAAPDPSLEGIAEWGTKARAALLVARSQLSAERDALARQANEVGALVLGEPLTATSAAGVARQLERALGRR